VFVQLCMEILPSFKIAITYTSISSKNMLERDDMFCGYLYAYCKKTEVGKKNFNSCENI